MATPTLPETPWKLCRQDILNALKVSSANGLSAAEAKVRRKHYGPNRLRETKRTSAWLILARQFHSLIVLLLAVAAAVSFLFGDWLEGVAIAAVIVINALIGFFLELKATGMEARKQFLLAEQRNMLFKSTAVTRGSAEGAVVATGMQTELGHISSLVEEAQEETTPLEKRLDRLGHRLIWVTLAIAILVAI
jgi:magnesium-transporting ATPase (P-type)